MKLTLAFVAVVAAIVIFAPTAASHDPYRADVNRVLLPPSAEHWWGTDHLGRDLWSRWVIGARHTLLLAVGAGGIAIIGGVLVGIGVGSQSQQQAVFARGLLSGLLAFPPLIMALLIVAPLPRSLLTIALAAGIGQIASLANVIAAQTERIMAAEYRLASSVLGASKWHIMQHCVLRNLQTTLRALVPMTIAYSLITASTLSFLGLGERPDLAEWGALLAESRFYFRDIPISAVAPGLGLLAVMLCLQSLASRRE